MTTTLRALAVLAIAAGLTLNASPANAGQGHKDPQPVIVVLDHTAGKWPVASVVRAWDQSRHVRIKVGTSCLEADYCVNVYAGDYGTEWMGGAAPDSFYGARVLLNDNPAVAHLVTDPAARSAVVCHEIAHTLGITHQPASTGQWGCIANSDHAHTTALPSYRDKRLLAAVAKVPTTVPWGALRTFAWFD